MTLRDSRDHLTTDTDLTTMPYLCILIYFVFFAGVAMTIAEGLWNNTLTLMAILICGPLAIAVGLSAGAVAFRRRWTSPSSRPGTSSSAACGWCSSSRSWCSALFADRVASRVRMKFVPPLEMAAGPLMGLLVAVMFTSFLTFTLYTIPIGAGEWKIGDAAGWQKTTMQSGSAPFNTRAQGHGRRGRGPIPSVATVIARAFA